MIKSIHDEEGPSMADEVKLTPADPVSGEYEAPVAGEATGTAGKAIAALVCGILSLVILGVILGAVAVVLGVLARKEIAVKPGLGGSGMALAGIIVGAVGFVLSIVILVLGGTGVIG